METGRVVEINKALKFGIIDVDGTNEVVLFEKRSIQNLKWDKLRNGNNGTRVAFKLSPGQTEITPKHAKIVTSIQNQAALEAGLSLGWKSGTVEKKFDNLGFGRIIGNGGLVITFNDFETEFQPDGTSFNSISEGDVVDYQDRELLPDVRFASKVKTL